MNGAVTASGNFTWSILAATVAQAKCWFSVWFLRFSALDDVFTMCWVMGQLNRRSRPNMAAEIT
jgi:hypothetical protein